LWGTRLSHAGASPTDVGNGPSHINDNLISTLFVVFDMNGARSRNLGLITLKKREPTRAAIDISTLIRSVWLTVGIDKLQATIRI
jgi:hypothetical protein